MRRSRAFDRLVAMIELDVVTPDELAQVSPSTREDGNSLLAIGTGGGDNEP